MEKALLWEPWYSQLLLAMSMYQWRKSFSNVKGTYILHNIHSFFVSEPFVIDLAHIKFSFSVLIFPLKIYILALMEIILKDI